MAADNNLAALLLTKYFPSPFGGMFARTGWNIAVSLSSDIAMAEFRISERSFGSHQQFDAGSFQIYGSTLFCVESYPSSREKTILQF